MDSLTLKEFEKKTKQKFMAMRQKKFHEQRCVLVPVGMEGWEGVWECINPGCHLMVSEDK